MIHIIHNIPRPDGALVERFSRHGSATVHEAMGRLGAMSWKIKPLARGMKVCGPAFTVQVQAGDNVMILRAIRDARPGDVLVVDCGRCPESGPFGELAATECQVKGLGGFVTTGSVRDSAEIISMGFPVFSGGVSIVGTVKESLGRINHPVSAGGVIVNPGDIILGDDDGVVVVPLAQAGEILEKSDARVAKEAGILEKLRAGGSIFDIYGYQAVLDRQGCVEERT
ncbi:4-carboxy-4-hydroxy-2-oxoadipate aldolase/oxaloacetate decarboxylase [uncultured Oscillibacter sp.]|uniref:4-carboxy-4-hydroxy-2-oxoadipate aldolase/oxaloacetate decarboxylase n=1 Tax=uncultured Oscillibacter sp. TaxID=876091 RepID=UPI0025DDA10F|nr:4-carboxy-4-hydroxy-2-oxoadipate aldolase/oxaloacetate decarboxylase [uncultured Oscillibacter sp.]